MGTLLELLDLLTRLASHHDGKVLGLHGGGDLSRGIIALGVAHLGHPNSFLLLDRLIALGEMHATHFYCSLRLSLDREIL